MRSGRLIVGPTPQLREKKGTGGKFPTGAVAGGGGGVTVLRVTDDVVVVEDGRPVDVLVQAVDVPGGEADGRPRLLDAGGAPQRHGQLVGGGADLASLGPHPPAGPVAAA